MPGFNTIWLMVRTKIYPEEKASDKVLHDKAFAIGSNPNYDKYQQGFASMVYKFFDKKSRDTIFHIGEKILFPKINN